MNKKLQFWSERILFQVWQTSPISRQLGNSNDPHLSLSQGPTEKDQKEEEPVKIHKPSADMETPISVWYKLIRGDEDIDYLWGMKFLLEENFYPFVTKGHYLIVA